MRMMRHDVVATDVWRAVRTVKLSERSRATNSDASQVAYDAQRSVVFGFEMGVTTVVGLLRRECVDTAAPLIGS